ncbi:MAG: redoxin domain-containing protein [Planctomycetes bacterium]|nr:redoxin domain-containing protein [Planctomycetota bacterium]
MSLRMALAVGLLILLAGSAPLPAQDTQPPGGDGAGAGGDGGAGGTPAPPVESEFLGKEFRDFDVEKDWIQGPASDPRSLRGRVVLVSFFEMTGGICEAYSLPHAKELHAQFREKGLTVVGVWSVLGNEAHQRPEMAQAWFQMLQLPFPIARDRGRATIERYPVNKEFRTPMTIVVDREGVIRLHALGYEPEQRASIAECVEKCIGQDPAEAALARAATQDAEQGLKAQEAGDFAAAYGTLRRARAAIEEKKAKVAPDLAEKVTIAIDQIESQAKVALDAAAALVAAKKFSEAETALTEVKTKFAGTPAAKEAEGKIDAIHQDPEANAIVEATRQSAAAADLWKQAEAAEKAKAWPKAIGLYRKIVETCPLVTKAAEAKQRIEDLEKDPEVQKAMKEEQARADCEKWLRNGDNYFKNKMYEKAIVEYKRVIEKYPGTAFAATARQKMAEAEKKRKGT